MNYQGLAEFLIESVAAKNDRTTIGLGGFPFVGKTTVAKRIVQEFPGTILPLECFVQSRACRNADGRDGCAPESYDVPQLVSCIESLKSGGRMQLARYSWALGNRSDVLDNYQLSPHGVLVIDGTVSIVPPVAAQCDLVVFIRPTDFDLWFRRAVERDVNQRHWSEAQAYKENEKKFATTTMLYQHYANRITYEIYMDFEKETGGGDAFRYQIAETAKGARAIP